MADGFLSTGGIGIDTYNEALEPQGKSIQDGDIILGAWAIIAEDPDAAQVADHALYQSNEYIKWGGFGPADHATLFKTGAQAIEHGLYESWDADTAAT
ncbi:MAG: hypothetical protein ACI9W1_003416 [Candidatus Azotimanducaceae bacterium]